MTPPPRTADPPRRGLGGSLVSVAFLGAAIGGVGAPLITPVALHYGVSLDAAQWTLTVTLFAGAITAPVLGRLGSGAHRRATVLFTLLILVVGGILTTAPLPFAGLLVGRALQGLGLGVIALLMSVARDHLPDSRARSTIATISVASTVGIGVAYPLMGMLDQVAGLRVAYGTSLALSCGALALAWIMLPPDIHGQKTRIDLPGAVLLAVGTLGVLIVVAQRSTWDPAWVGATILLGAGIALTAWFVLERRSPAPLVDVRLLTRGNVVRANGAMLVAGVGMYLLFSLLTRYVQTPVKAGYGFGLSGALAGAALIPFSVFGFAAGRITPWLALRVNATWIFVGFAASVLVAAGLFVSHPQSLAEVLVSMAVLGIGVGGASAIMPSLVLAGVPRQETSSVLSINQIVRSVGFSVGSALAGLLLAHATPAATLFPTQHGYSIAAIWVIPLLAVSIVVCLVRRAAH